MSVPCVFWDFICVSTDCTKTDNKIFQEMNMISPETMSAHSISKSSPSSLSLRLRPPSAALRCRSVPRRFTAILPIRGPDLCPNDLREPWRRRTTTVKEFVSLERAIDMSFVGKSLMYLWLAWKMEMVVQDHSNFSNMQFV